MEEIKKQALIARDEFQQAKEDYQDRIIDSDEFIAEKEKYYKTLEKLILGDDICL